MNGDPFLEAIIQHMQPEGRAHHQAGMLRHLIGVLPDEVTLADLVVGWQVLARPHTQQEPTPVTSRREICAELAVIAATLTSEQGHLASAVKAWQAWLDDCQQSADPRLVVVGKIFARELVELQSA